MISSAETVRLLMSCLVDRKEERQASEALYVTSLVEVRHKEPAPTEVVMLLKPTVPSTESARQGDEEAAPKLVLTTKFITSPLEPKVSVFAPCP